MSKYDNDLLSKARINRVAINTPYQMTLFSDDHYFVITAVGNVNGMQPSINVAAYEKKSPYLVSGIKPRPQAKVLYMSDYRKK